MAHGTSASLDEMPDDLRVVRGELGASSALVAEMRQHDTAVGGRSPLTAQASTLSVQKHLDAAVAGLPEGI